MTQLPDFCFSVLPYTGQLIRLRYGQSDYRLSQFNTDDTGKNRLLASALNQEMDVSLQQERAMLNGAMFGFDKPVADPENYDESGEFDQHCKNHRQKRKYPDYLRLIK